MGDTKKTVEFQGDEPMGDAAKYQSHEIVDFANSVDPGTVQQLGTTYEGIAKNFGDSLQSFQKNAQRLSEAWKGEDASQEACRQLALLYVAALTMQINANQIGGVLKNLGSDKPDFSKTTFLYGGAYGIPEVTSIENNDGGMWENKKMSLAEFKHMVTSNGDYFAGKDVDPVDGIGKDSDQPGFVYAYEPNSTSKNNFALVDKSTPADQRGVYAQYLLYQGNNGIFTTWQGIPQKVTLDLPPKLSDASDKPTDDGSKNNKNPSPTNPTGPTGTPTPTNYQTPNLSTGSPTSPNSLDNVPTSPTDSNNPGNTDLSGVNSPTGTDLSGLQNPSLTNPGGTNLSTPPTTGDGGGTSLTDPSTGRVPTTGLGNPSTPCTPGSLKTPSIGSGGLKSSSNPLGLKTGSGMTPADGVIGARWAVNTAAAAEEAAAGTAATNAAARAGGYMPMMPPMMGGQQGQNQDRERNAWLTEDEDIWGADDDVAPPLIG